MLITLDKLNELNACSEAKELFKTVFGDSGSLENIVKEVKRRNNHYDYVVWLLPKLMNREDCLKFAIFSAELILHIYEDKYPMDKKPRKTIEAAKKVLENDTEENRNAAYAAYAAVYAANAAVYAAYAAVYAANAAVYAANAAAYAANAAAYAANAAVYDARKKTYTKIIDFGIVLLEEK